MTVLQAEELNTRDLGVNGHTVSVWWIRPAYLEPDSFEVRIVDGNGHVAYAEVFTTVYQARQRYDHPIMLVPAEEPIPWH